MQSAPTIHITETVEKGIQDVQGQREGTCVGKYWHPRVFTAGGGGVHAGLLCTSHFLNRSWIRYRNRNENPRALWQVTPGITNNSFLVIFPPPTSEGEVASFQQEGWTQQSQRWSWTWVGPW